MNELSPTFGCIVLTQGNRPAQLKAAISSILGQVGVTTDVVVVGNGWQPKSLPAGVKSVFIKENLGIPAGRNAGVNSVAGDFLFFLDDCSREPIQTSQGSLTFPPSPTYTNFATSL